MKARTWKLHSWGMLDREKRRDLIRDSDRFRSIIDYDLVSALVSLSVTIDVLNFLMHVICMFNRRVNVSKGMGFEYFRNLI